MRIRTTAALWMIAGLVIGLLTLTGCGASSPYMKPATAAAAPAAGNATVIFVRPGSYAKGVSTSILDADGRFLGDSLPNSYFTVSMPPGEHIFLAWAENTAALRAELAAGKTYYVRVSPRMGAWSARMQLLAVKPGSEDWPKVKEWLAKAKPYATDEAKGQAYLDGRKEDVSKRVARAKQILTEYTPEQLAERTIKPGDAE